MSESMKPFARIIRPNFFIDEELTNLPLEARYLFAGLWVLADKAGRLEDKPKRIKYHIFPYDQYDVSALLDLLSPRFIVRYGHFDQEYIQIRNWLKHQKVHWNETESQIPEPTEPQTDNLRSSYVEPYKELDSSLKVVEVYSKSNSKSISRSKKQETGQKSDHSKAVRYFCDQYLEKFGVKYQFAGVKDGKLIKTMLATFGLEKLKEIIDVFLNSNDEWLQEAGFTIGTLNTKANKIAQGRGNYVKQTAGHTSGGHAKAGPIKI